MRFRPPSPIRVSRVAPFRRVIVRGIAVLGVIQMTACAGLIGEVNPVTAAVVAGNPERVRTAAAAQGAYRDGTPEVDGTNVCGERPLHLAIQRGSLEIVQILLSEGADPDLPSVDTGKYSGCASYWNVTTPPGYPPLHYAILFARPVIAEALLFAGAEPMRTTPANDTALDLAESAAGMEKLVAYMQSPLHLGARAGDLKRMQMALDRGADVNEAMPLVGTTPVEEALLGGHRTAVDYLLARGADGADGL